MPQEKNKTPANPICTIISMIYLAGLGYQGYLFYPNFTEINWTSITIFSVIYSLLGWFFMKSDPLSTASYEISGPTVAAMSISCVYIFVICLYLIHPFQDSVFNFILGAIVGTIANFLTAIIGIGTSLFIATTR